MNFRKFKFASSSSDACPIHLIKAEEFDKWLKLQNRVIKKWIRSNEFTARSQEVCLVPDSLGNLESILIGLGDRAARNRERFTLGGSVNKLPHIKYKIESKHNDLELGEHSLGWLLSQYAFTNYLNKENKVAALVKPDGINSLRIEKIAQGEVITRDLVNTPANEMGPKELEEFVNKTGGRLDKNKLSMHAKDGYVTALKSLFIQTPGMKQKYSDLYKIWDDIHKDKVDKFWSEDDTGALHWGKML